MKPADPPARIGEPGPKPARPDSSKVPGAASWIAAVSLAWALFKIGSPFAEAAVFAAALSCACAPLARRLRAMWGRRASGLAIATLLSLGAAAPASWAWRNAFIELDGLMAAQEQRSTTQAAAGDWRQAAISAGARAAAKIRSAPAWTERAALAPEAPWGLIGLLAISLYFMTADGAAGWAWARGKAGDGLGPAWGAAFERAGRAFEQTAKGCLWFGLASFGALWLLFWAAKAPAPMAFAVAGACASMLPFVGPVLVACVAAALASKENLWGPLALLGFGAGGLGLANNVLRPKWIGDASGLPMPAALFSMAGAAIAWGPAGLLAGPAIAAAALALADSAALKRVRE